MITPIPFDPQRFRAAAAQYLAERPDYAPGLAGLVAGVCGLDGTGRLLDLGCGPGQLARAFLPYAASALAIDPEPDMLALGGALSHGMALTFMQGSDADLSPTMGPFRLVTIGRAFHWMDRVQTARRLDAMIEPAGAVALFRVEHLDVPENAWQAGVASLVAEHAETRTIWRQPGWVKHEAILLASPFCRLTRVGVVETVRTPLAALLGRGMAMRPGSRARLGEAGLADLHRRLDAVLAPFVADGAVTEVLESEALIARRA